MLFLIFLLQQRIDIAVAKLNNRGRRLERLPHLLAHFSSTGSKAAHGGQKSTDSPKLLLLITHPEAYNILSSC